MNKTIKNFDRQNLKEIRQSVQTALNKVAMEYGIKIDMGNIRFTGNNFRCKLDANTTVGTIVNSFEFKPSAPGSHYIGKTFKRNNSYFTVTAYNPNKPKNCFELTNQNGRKFVCSKDQLLTFLK